MYYINFQQEGTVDKTGFNPFIQFSTGLLQQYWSTGCKTASEAWNLVQQQHCILHYVCCHTLLMDHTSWSAASCSSFLMQHIRSVSPPLHHNGQQQYIYSTNATLKVIANQHYYFKLSSPPTLIFMTYCIVSLWISK